MNIQEFGKNTLVLKSIPAVMKLTQDIKIFFKDFISILIDNFKNPNFSNLKPKEKVIRAACRAAVKAKDKLVPEEMRELIINLKKCSQPVCCPHGRPTMIRITLSELEKKFRRQ